MGCAADGAGAASTRSRPCCRVASIRSSARLPMLIKHYIELKGRFAGFNVDASYHGTLDGLVFVRVEDIPAKMRVRLGGKG